MRQKRAALLGFCAAVALMLAMMLPLAAPTAKADDAGSCSETHIAVTGGELRWGLRESYTSYIQKFSKTDQSAFGAGGGIKTSDGASWDSGAEQFRLPVTNDQSPIDGPDSGKIALSGTIHFTGHPWVDKDTNKAVEPITFVLDTTLGWMYVALEGGNKGAIYVNTKSRPAKEMTTFAKPEPFVERKDLRLADVTFDQTVNINGDTELSSSQVTITSEADEFLFAGQYKTNPGLEPLTLTLKVDPKKCGPKPKLFGGKSGSAGSGSGSGSGSGGSYSGTASGPVWDFTRDVNDRLVLANELMGNTGKFMDNVDKFKERFTADRATRTGESTSGEGAGGDSGTGGLGQSTTTTGGSGGTSGGNTSGAASTGTSLPGGASTSGRSGGSGSASTMTRAQAGGAASTSGAASGSGATGTNVGCSGAPSVTDSMMRWNVKDSFISYLTGSIARGRFETSGAGYDNGFTFGGQSGSFDPETKQGQFSYPGTVHFWGHEGVLDMTIANPVVSINGNTGSLAMDVVSNDMSGATTDYGNTQFADLAVSDVSVSGNAVTITATPLLSATGAKAFADFYTPGQELAPLTLTATLGAPDCSGSSGGSGSGGAAGARASGVSTGLAAPGAKNSSAAAGAAAGGDPSGTSASVGARPEGESQFKIKSIGGKAVKDKDAKGKNGEDNDSATVRAAGTGDLDPTTTLLMLIAALVVSGGALSSLVVRHPA